MLAVAAFVLLSPPINLIPRYTQPQSRDQTRGFKSREEFFAAHKNEVIERLGLQALDPREEFDRMVLEEMGPLDKVAGFKTIVTKGEGDQIASQPEVGIIISPERLDFIRQRSSVREFRQILRFLLAHEKAHQVQYLEYSAKSVHSGDAEIRRVYECQADILAAKYLIESLGEPKPEHQAAIEDVLQVAFDLGVEAFSDSSTYPSHDGRRTAVRLGMTSGLIELLRKRLPDPPAIELINSLAGKVNIRQGETVMSWSFRVSKKITHHKLKLWSDITVEGQEVKWERRPDHFVVKFVLTYKNNGEKAIRVDMEAQCISASPAAPDNTRHWLKWSAQNFIFTIPAGETHIVRGALQWYGNDNHMKRLIFPPEDTALMSAQ